MRSSDPYSARTSRVPSLEPSSTTTARQSGTVWARIESSAGRRYGPAFHVLIRKVARIGEPAYETRRRATLGPLEVCPTSERYDSHQAGRRGRGASRPDDQAGQAARADPRDLEQPAG